MQLVDSCGMLHEVFENVKSDNISIGVQPNLTIDIGAQKKVTLRALISSHGNGKEPPIAFVIIVQLFLDL
jgi:hypothetical protein